MKAVLTTVEGLPDDIKKEYDLKDGRYILKVEGEHPVLVTKASFDEANTKLAEFRDNNRTLNGKVTDLEGKLASYKDLDPVKYKEMGDKIKEFEKSGVKGGEDVTKLILKAVEDAVKPLNEREEKRAASEKAAMERADRELLKSTLTASGIKAGVDDRAVADYVERGMKIFKIVDGNVVARRGDAPIFRKDKPSEELTVDAWAIHELPEEAPHLYKPSRGGGANNNGDNGNRSNKKIIGADPMEFGLNIEGIAKGDVIVQD